MTVDLPANRLFHEKSLYLRQHAYNPVDWYPWGEEAFEIAKKEDKPILLSIGYSSCHWCHVMAHESFEDDEVADLLNERFISIKLDREERPDVDAIYMDVCQRLNGHGGWPLNVFLTPEGKPFYAGTYFPKETKNNRTGFKEIIMRINELYEHNRDKLEEIGNDITNNLQPKLPQAVVLNEEVVNHAFEALKSSYDHKYGGFGSAPKFPIPSHLYFLMYYSHYYKKGEALQMVEKTLSNMADGGIFDQLGGGFCRYSVDEKWLVPHFEKMLYDNALLIYLYTQAYQLTKNEKWKKTVEATVQYVLRDLKNDEGGFFAAEDADSEGVEGKFYMWSKEEIIQVLGEQEGNLFCNYYDVTEQGNFEGENILHKNHVGAKNTIHFDLEKAKTKLVSFRNERVRPSRDEKILTFWNGFMIASLAFAGKVFQNNNWIKEAENSIHFLEENLIQDNRLMVRYADGEVSGKAFSQDYASLAWAYVELYEATFAAQYLLKAKKLIRQMIDLFWDKENGGFFLIGRDQEQLITNPIEAYDGALPSANSIASLQMWKVAKLTGDVELQEKVQQLLQRFSDELVQYPTDFSYLMQTVLLNFQTTKEWVLAVTDKAEIKQISAGIHAVFSPHIAKLVLDDRSRPDLMKAAPFTEKMKTIDNKPTAFFCEEYQCQEPTTNMEEWLTALHLNDQ